MNGKRCTGDPLWAEITTNGGLRTGSSEEFVELPVALGGRPVAVRVRVREIVPVVFVKGPAVDGVDEFKLIVETTGIGVTVWV